MLPDDDLGGGRYRDELPGGRGARPELGCTGASTCGLGARVTGGSVQKSSQWRYSSASVGMALENAKCHHHHLPAPCYSMRRMLIARNAEEEVVVMADDGGLDSPVVRAPNGEWRVDVPAPEALHDFVPVEDMGEREQLLQEARAFLTDERAAPRIAAVADARPVAAPMLAAQPMAASAPAYGPMPAAQPTARFALAHDDLVKARRWRLILLAAAVLLVLLSVGLVVWQGR